MSTMSTAPSPLMSAIEHHCRRAGHSDVFGLPRRLDRPAQGRALGARDVENPEPGVPGGHIREGIGDGEPPDFFGEHMGPSLHRGCRFGDIEHRQRVASRDVGERAFGSDQVDRPLDHAHPRERQRLRRERHGADHGRSLDQQRQGDPRRHSSSQASWQYHGVSLFENR